jgi:hypothetical protein
MRGRNPNAAQRSLERLDMRIFYVFHLTYLLIFFLAIAASLVLNAIVRAGREKKQLASENYF